MQLFIFFIILGIVFGDQWQVVDEAVTIAIKNGTFPGAVLLIADKTGILHQKAYGSYTYGNVPPYNSNNPPIQIDTLWDLASCTKVTGATSAIAQFYEQGILSVDTRVADILGEDYSQNGKGPITVLNCLLHNAGYPPDPDPEYWDLQFGCPETPKHPPLENFSCQQKIFNGLLTQTLVNPIGTKYVYSDLSFITLQWVVGAVAQKHNLISRAELRPECVVDFNQRGTWQCYFEAYLNKYVFKHLGMDHTGFLPQKNLWSKCAPTENTTSYLPFAIQGQVSDGNAYALGGIAGHAGLFSTAHDLYKLASNLLFPSTPPLFLNSSTIKFFTTEYNHSQSSRALGWNTNDPTVFDYGWDLLCGNMSAKTYTHVGFTGTQICADPERGLLTIFLTNRVYPTETNYKIENVRRHVNSAVVGVYDTFFDRQEESEDDNDNDEQRHDQCNECEKCKDSRGNKEHKKGLHKTHHGKHHGVTRQGNQKGGNHHGNHTGLKRN